MTDFAAAAMLRLIRLGLARQGLAPTPRAAGAALVPLDHKRTLLTGLMQQHGPGVLLRIGDAVLDAPDEPTLTALTLALDPPDLLSRWQRLERYVHSRHRTQRLDEAPGRVRLRHVSLQPGEPPWPAEDLLVWGLLIGLLRKLGPTGLQASLHGQPLFGDGRWQDASAAAAHDTAALALRWDGPSAAAGAGAVPSSVAGTLAHARACLAADCGAGWTLPRLAAALRLPPRTLQRRLGAAGSSYSALWTEVRLARSAQLLAQGRDSPALIGYQCGFADQAHFTRTFRRHTAITPACYRSQFSVPATRP